MSKKVFSGAPQDSFGLLHQCSQSPAPDGSLDRLPQRRVFVVHVNAPSSFEQPPRDIATDCADSHDSDCRFPERTSEARDDIPHDGFCNRWRFQRVLSSTSRNFHSRNPIPRTPRLETASSLLYGDGVASIQPVGTI